MHVLLEHLRLVANRHVEHVADEDGALLAAAVAAAADAADRLRPSHVSFASSSASVNFAGRDLPLGVLDRRRALLQDGDSFRRGGRSVDEHRRAAYPADLARA